MMNFRVIVCVLALLASLCLGAGCERSANARLIRQTYAKYARSGPERDGNAYAALITQDSMLRYGELLKYALGGKRADIKKLEPADKLEILIMRIRGTKETLKSLDAAAFTRWHIEQGWSDFDPGVPESIIDLRIDADTANGELAYTFTTRSTPRFGRRGLYSGGSSSEVVGTGIRYYFVKEGGAWKVDEIATLPSWDTDLAAAAKDEGLELDRFLVLRASEICDVDPAPDTIWDRMPR